MPTYAQLEAEAAWNNEITTTELDWLADELCRRTGRPRDAAGTKGDNNHLNGGHRSQEWILTSRYCTDRTYTVRSGLTVIQKRHIAALDFTPGSAEQMVAQCKRIYAAMRAGLLDEVVEFYGNVNGDRIVDGWDNDDNVNVTSDDSHLWHWHLTFDRRHLTNRALMERIVSIVMGDDDMTPEERKLLADLNWQIRNVPNPDGSRGLLTAAVGRWGAEVKGLKTALAEVAAAGGVSDAQVADILARAEEAARAEVADALHALADAAGPDPTP